MSDTDEPTPWEDINPPMVSAQQRGPVSRCSATDEARKTFRNELTACLALTAPVGMTEENRRDWLTVAWDALKHLPADVLASGARKARQKCDHPSKIVPTIIEETAQLLRWRNECESGQLRIAGPSKKHVLDRRGEPMSDEDTAKLNEILENLGATARYRTDGSRYFPAKSTP